MTLLAFTLLLAGASAQKVTVAKKGKAKVTLEDGQSLRHLDSLQLDSVYKYWDNVVTEHPKDEAAWRKLSEIEQEMVIYRLILYGKEKEAEQLHNKLSPEPIPIIMLHTRVLLGTEVRMPILP